MCDCFFFGEFKPLCLLSYGAAVAGAALMLGNQLYETGFLKAQPLINVIAGCLEILVLKSI